MIKIIKPGKRFRTFYKATCKRCGCEFEFENDDINCRERCLDGMAWIKCPTCNQAIKFKPLEIEYREE